MLINTNKYEFKGIEFRLPNDLKIIPSANIPFFLKKMDLDLDIISFNKGEKKEGKYVHIAIINNPNGLSDDLDEYFNKYIKDYDLNLLSIDKIKVCGDDAVQFIIGSYDETPKMRYIIFQHKDKEYHLIFTTLTFFENSNYYVETLINSLKFID